ncbi:type IV secretion system protein VirB2 [Epibacterium ulvae]|uniref:Type IV secretion system protein VirB2 n=1 Tax=Epibacterium ulvae TaxID=1156985 RepID=A0A1G5RHG2_9RHOB|nr:TrbC/VirB2 family protein [Epibacterium ulvae]SCZ73525.1 type IV secretion system protein VirB2 [Epibacterium ulvae]
MKSIVAVTNMMRAPLTIALVFLFGFSEPAAAQGFTDFLNNVLAEFNNARRPLALIAIMIVGALYMFNVIDMRRTGQVIVGIIVIFAAVEILDLITA